MVAEPLDRLRGLCLALPEVGETQAWGDPTFRVRGRIFAMFKTGSGRPAVWMKAPHGAQEVLMGADPERFFRPPYVGHKGWIGMWLDAAPDWDEVGWLTRRSYAMTAPKRLAQTAQQ